MKSKRRSLGEAMKAARDDKPVVASPQQSKETSEENQSNKIPPSRQGKKFVGGYFLPEVAKQLKIMGVKNDKSNQELLAEALNLLFEKYGENPIA